MDILSSWFSSGIGVIILNIPGDFMCVNVMFDTSCEVSDIIKTTYRPCGQYPDGESRDKSIWSKLWCRKQKTLKIRVFRLSLACSALHGCLMRSVSNLLNTTSISCPLKPILVWIWSIFSISRETIEKPLDKFLYYEVLTKFTGRLTQLKICMTNNKSNVWIEQNSRYLMKISTVWPLTRVNGIFETQQFKFPIWNEFSM